MLKHKPSSLTPFFHGTRASFDQFDGRFLGTGEGVRSDGFCFTGSLHGACWHAMRLAGQPGEALVYVCTFPPEELWLTRGRPISEHPEAERRAWDLMPLCYSSLDRAHDWYERFLTCDYVNRPNDNELRETETIRLLSSFGFSAIGDYEGGHAESYHEGATALLIRPAAVTILEKIPVDEMFWNQVKRGTSYRLAEHTAPFLGRNSRLRDMS